MPLVHPPSVLSVSHELPGQAALVCPNPTTESARQLLSVVILLINHHLLRTSFDA